MNELLTTAEAAKFLKVAQQTLAVWRMKLEGPRYCIVGARGIRYRREDLEAFIREGQPKEAGENCGAACKCGAK